MKLQQRFFSNPNTHTSTIIKCLILAKICFLCLSGPALGGIGGAGGLGGTPIPIGEVVDLSCVIVPCNDRHASVCGIGSRCRPCSTLADCTHIQSWYDCYDRVCGECSSNLPCPGSQICLDYLCGTCTTHTECQNVFPNKPYCQTVVVGDPSSNVCRECFNDAHCANPSKSRCDLTSFQCLPCQTHDDCVHLGNLATSHLCYNNKCIVSSNLEIKVSATDSPEIFIVEIPPELTANVDVSQALHIQLKNTESSLYTYKLTKITDTKYEVRFQVSGTVPKTDLQATYTLPSSNPISTTYKTKWTGETEVKKIPYINQEQKAAVQTVETVAQVATTAVTAVSGSMLLMGANPAILWAMVNLLQTFYYLVFINVNYPANLQIFLEVFSLGGLNFIPNPIAMIFPSIEETILSVPDRFEDYDVNGLFLANAGNMLLIWFVTFFIYIIAAIGKKYMRTAFKLARAGFAKVVKWFEWSGVLRALITSYPEISQASLLQMRVLAFGSTLLSFSSIFGLAFTVFSFLFPVFIYLIVKKTSKNKETLNEKYSTLVEEYTLERNTPKYFTVFLLFRRLLMNMILVFLHDIPYAQISFLSIISVIFVALLVKFRPYSSKADNITNILSEILFLGVYALIFVLVHDDHTHTFSEDSRLNFGWAMIIVCGVILMIGLGVSFYQQYVMIKEGIKFMKEFMRIRKEKAARRKVHVEESIDLSKENGLVRDSSTNLSIDISKENGIRRDSSVSRATTESLSQSIEEMLPGVRRPRIRRVRNEAATRKLQRLREINFVF